MYKNLSVPLISDSRALPERQSESGPVSYNLDQEIQRKLLGCHSSLTLEHSQRDIEVLGRVFKNLFLPRPIDK